MTDNTTKERPILFSASMVNAILEGRKTMTRRVIKRNCSGRAKEVGSSRNWHLADPDVIRACPYGKIGARLWVRETFAQNNNQLSDIYSDTTMVYRADGVSRALDNGVEKAWTPSIFMPRRASRITLEITSVSAEQLQDISEQDAMAEGVDAVSIDAMPRQATMNRRADFKQIWESINGKGSWELNPWCWVIEFNRIPALEAK